MKKDSSIHKHHIFISYSHKDGEIVEKLAASLSKQGLSTWLDKDHLDSGDNWENQIKSAIFESEICLILLNQNSDPLKPKISKEWSAIQECRWKRKDLLIFIIDFRERETPPFLNDCEKLFFKKYKHDFDALAKKVQMLLSNISDKEKAEETVNSNRLLTTNKRFSEIVNVLSKER